MAFSRNKVLRWTLLVLRVVLGAVFVYGGYVKLRAPWALFAMGIDSYHILPFRFVEPVARILPWLEVVIGLALIAGRWLRISAAGVSLLLAIFFTAMVRAVVKGQDISCGCFGPGEPISKWTLLRDGSMLAASLFVTWMALRSPRRTA
ncbi:MAG TPA: MauE/DoxX family redox-associated membrane protein [Bryobacteraceae bacterium]|nr:MauE/DoxX family redox-associated membrane protein [Bryobacteraceae bacterium]